MLGIGIAYAVEKFLLPTHGVITEYGLTATPNEINWGNVLNGTSTNQSVTLTNTGTQDFVSLTAYYGDETGTLSTLVDPFANYELTWDGEDFSLAVDESLLVNFTLTINNATTGPFTFTTYISDKG